MSAPSYSPQDARWRRLPEERPHQILEAAIAEFGEHGIGGARLERIAEKSERQRDRQVTHSSISLTAPPKPPLT